MKPLKVILAVIVVGVIMLGIKDPEGLKKIASNFVAAGAAAQSRAAVTETQFPSFRWRTFQNRDGLFFLLTSADDRPIVISSIVINKRYNSDLCTLKRTTEGIFILGGGPEFSSMELHYGDTIRFWSPTQCGSPIAMDIYNSVRDVEFTLD